MRRNDAVNYESIQASPPIIRTKSPPKGSAYRQSSMKLASNESNNVQHPTKLKSYAMDDKDEDYPQQLATPMARLTALSRKQYLNPLARLDYEDKEMEVFTKITKQSQKTVQKKLKARNQLADFHDDEFDEDREIDDLISFKFGKTNRFSSSNQPNQVYFETEPEMVVETTQPLKISQLHKKSSTAMRISESPQIPSSEIQLPMERSNYFKPEPYPVQHPSPIQQSFRSQERTETPVKSLLSSPPSEKLLYCNSCESFMTEQEAEVHCRNCFFDFSKNWTQRKQQIIQKLQKIYQNLGKLPASQNVERMTNILVDVTYLDDSRKIEEYIESLKSIRNLTEMEAVLVRRVAICLEEKVSLRSYIGPRLNIFGKKQA